MRLRFVGLAVAALLAAPTGVALLATKPQAQQPTFRGAVDVVSVDARVIGKNGEPVTNLTAEDFEVKERGKLQKIDSFKLVRIDDRDPAPLTTDDITAGGPQAQELGREDVRLIAILLDDYHVSRPRSVFTRDRLAAFVQSISPRDLVALVYPLTRMEDVIWSRDHDAQADEIARFEGRKFDFSPRNAIDQKYQQARIGQQERMRDQIVSAELKRLCQYLNGLRSGPKLVLLVSDGIGDPVPPHVPDMGLPMPIPNFDPDGRRITDVAIENNTAVYPFDTRGVEWDELDMRDTIQQAATSRMVVAGAQERLRNLAYETGGRPMVNTEGYVPILQQMLRDTGAYYLLGYTSIDPKHDGLFHEISVNVRRGGVDVHARKGYWASSEEDIRRMMAAPKPPLPPGVKAAIEALAVAPSTQAVRTTVLTALGQDGTTEVTIAWERADADVRALRVHAARDGDVAVFDGQAPRDPSAQGGIVTFASKPGPLTVKLEALTADGRVVDRDDRAIDVPDFTTAGPALSTPAVFRARTALEVRRLRASTSDVPTVGRAFTRADRLLVRFHAYAGSGGAPLVSLRLLSAVGDPIAPLPAPAESGDGGFDSELPLSSLAIGDYVLEIQAAAGGGIAKAFWAFHVGG